MGPKSRPEPSQADQCPCAGYGPALQTPGRANADLLAQEQPEVETRDVRQQAFENVRMPPQVHPPHSPRLIQMRKRSLHSGIGARFRETRMTKGVEASTELEVTEYVE